MKWPLPNHGSLKLPSLESEEKKQTRNTIVVAGLIAEPTGTDGQRAIGRTSH
jgi:hypothetical protein